MGQCNTNTYKINIDLLWEDHGIMVWSAVLHVGCLWRWWTSSTIVIYVRSSLYSLSKLIHQQYTVAIWRRRKCETRIGRFATTGNQLLRACTQVIILKMMHFMWLLREVILACKYNDQNHIFNDMESVFFVSLSNLIAMFSETMIVFVFVFE